MIKVRFPPSPTGPMHIGTARALLFNYLFARQNKGTIVFRSEDTDRERSKPEYEQEILDGLQWLGLNFDEGPFRQSERSKVYERYFGQLKDANAIYPCFCTPAELEAERAKQKKEKLPPKYSGRCRDLTAGQIAEFEKEGRKPVWRCRVPDAEITFVDLIRGTVKEQGKNISDFVVRKADGQYLYHFTVVVDDIEMEITHVIRGEDHISNTSKHILLFRAFGVKIPEFAHLPLLLNKDKSKMSKRDDAGKPATIKRLNEDGYLPVAVVNYLALLGWHPNDEREFFTLEELTKEFDLKRVQKGGAIFDLERLNFLNSHYIRQLSVKELAEKIKPFLGFETPDGNYLEKCVALIQERLKFLAEAPVLLKFFFADPEYTAELFINSKMKVDVAVAIQALENCLTALESLEDWREENIQITLLGIVEKLGVKNGAVLWPVRVALTGEKFSPGAWEVAEALGKEQSLIRIKKGLDKLKKVR